MSDSPLTGCAAPAQELTPASDPAAADPPGPSTEFSFVSAPDPDQAAGRARDVRPPARPEETAEAEQTTARASDQVFASPFQELLTAGGRVRQPRGRRGAGRVRCGGPGGAV